MDPFSKYKTEEIEPIANEEDNKKCFQCQTTPANWICVYNGIFLCAFCAGEHRSFGVKISRIKSLVLDKLNPFQIETMRVGGNAKAKALLNSNWKDYKLYEKIVVFSSKLMEYHRNFIYDTIVGNTIQSPVQVNEVTEIMEKNNLVQRPILTEVPVKQIEQEIEVEEENKESNAVQEEQNDLEENDVNEEQTEAEKVAENEFNEKKKEEERKKKEEDDRIIITKEVSDEPFIKSDAYSKETTSSTKPSKVRVSEGKTKEKSDCALQ